MKKLNVFYENFKVGELLRNTELIYSFSYDKAWLKNPKRFALSLSLPLEKTVFGNKLTLSFFENLMPEGDTREIIGRTHAIKGAYDFLKEFGQDCAGAVVLSESEIPPFKKASSKKKLLDMKKIYSAVDSHHSVAQIIAEMDPGYLSLAGAQDKFATIYENSKFFLPVDGAPTTHIVKVPIHRRGVKESVFNEYFCMQLAQDIGFQIPANQVVGEGSHPLFVIERYDRSQDKLGQVHRLHQQDFCQAQGITSEQKYESQGGPGIKQNYELIMRHVHFKRRIENIHTFFDWVCFNLLIGNNDSHSKNISFLLKDGRIELAPFYDLICTSIYTGLKKSFAFSIGNRDDFSKIGKNQFEMLNEQLGLKSATLSERMKIIHDKVFDRQEALAKKMKARFPEVKIFKRIVDEIKDRAQGLKNQNLI